MKSFSILLISGLLLFGCSKDQGQNDSTETTQKTGLDVPLGHSMKGWELYSWPEGTSWKFSLLVGTNRLKLLDEVLTSSHKVTGIESLKLMLNQLPADEYISWTHRITQDVNKKLAFPDANVRNEIKAYCESRNLKLHITNL